MNYNLNADKCVRDILTEARKLAKTGLTIKSIELHPYWYYFLITKGGISHSTGNNGNQTIFCGIDVLESESVKTFEVKTLRATI
ncbi:hypothetical protein [Psychrobacter sp.]|uniref:hypothetical protein n=1 Tax=Psychrobacter sp. TaxID=56811 RepID=UPI003C76A1F0